MAGGELIYLSIYILLPYIRIFPSTDQRNVWDNIICMRPMVPINKIQFGPDIYLCDEYNGFIFLVWDLNCTPNCYGKTWRLLCPFFRNLHLRENLARDCFTSTASTVTNSVQNISLAVYVIVTNIRLQPLTTTFYNSMLVYFSLLKI